MILLRRVACAPRKVSRLQMVLAFMWQKELQNHEAKRTARVKLTVTVQETNADPAQANSSTMEGLMGAAKDAMGGGEAPPHDPAEAEAPAPCR